ncbi:MAG: hypothetical protein ACI8PD_001462 [Nitrospinales bacterium]|jgi:hypothetical protein
MTFYKRVPISLYHTKLDPSFKNDLIQTLSKVSPLEFEQLDGRFVTLSYESGALVLRSTDTKPSSPQFSYLKDFDVYVTHGVRDRQPQAPVLLSKEEMQIVLDYFQRIPENKNGNCEHRTHLMGLIMKVCLGLNPIKVYAYGCLKPEFLTNVVWKMHAAIALVDDHWAIHVLDPAVKQVRSLSEWQDSMGEVVSTASRENFDGYSVILKYAERPKGTILKTDMCSDIAMCKMSRGLNPVQQMRVTTRAISQDLIYSLKS